MEFIAAMLTLLGWNLLKAQDQRQRIGLLAGYLGRFEIEPLMETLIQGYMRALGEAQPERQAQVWQHFAASEERLSEQLQRLADALASADAASARVSTWPIAVPYAAAWWPAATFDLRQALRIHAQGISEVVRNSANRNPKDRAYTLYAEMLLLQHTCHWYCRSYAIASARLLARHQTPYAKVVESVSIGTRKAYMQLIKAQ